MFEDFVLALQNFKHNKMRTLLALLGIVIGVSSVVITMNLSSSLQATVSGIFNDLNNSLIFIDRNHQSGSRLTFDRRYADILKKYVSGTKQVFLFNAFNATVFRDKQSAGVKECFGIDYGYIEANKFELEYGAAFTLSDFMNGAKNVIIGEDIAAELFPEGNAAGKTLTLSVQEDTSSPPVQFLCTVNGVLKTRDTTVIGRMSRYILIPRSFMIRSLGRKDTASLVVLELYETGVDVQAVEKSVEKLSDDQAKTKNSVRLFSAQTLKKQIESNIAMISTVLSGIAVLSLLIGGVGIMNIMLVTVAERRQEIGIRKAIGASTRAILFQFLTEAAAISLIGGGIGLASGFLLSVGAVPVFLSAFIHSDKPIETILSFNIQGSVQAFLISASAGIFFGLYPAWQAGKLDPVKALEE